MTLCDAGPLVALVDLSDAHHARCRGWRGQDALWEWIEEGAVNLHDTAEGEGRRMRKLMRVYADTPMDLADASLLAASETLNLRRVFTVDRHFYIYRQQQGYAFEVVP